MKFEEEIKPQLKDLRDSDPYREANPRDLGIHSGAYVFYQCKKPMYVGIVVRHSRRGIRQRIREQIGGRSSQAPLASRMTIEDLRLGSMTLAQRARDYKPEFREQQERVGNMEVWAIEIQDCTTLAVFEIYAAVNLQSPYNDFCTH